MMKLFKRTCLFSVVCFLLLGFVITASAQQERERNTKKARAAAEQSAKAARVFDQIMGTREKSIPRDLLDRARTVAVSPSVIKAGLSFGAVAAAA